MKEFDFELLNNYAKYLDGNSRLCEMKDILSDTDAFNVYKFGEKKADWRGLPVASFKSDKGELMVAETKRLSHALVFGSTGSGKTQGLIFNSIFNMNRNTSYIILDVKREILPRTYNYVKELVGEENIKVLNFANPKNATDKFNFLSVLAEQFIAINNDEKLQVFEKKEKEDEIFARLHKYIVNIFPIRTQQDTTWDIGAREMIVGLIAGLIEDCVLERSVGLRNPIKPQQVSFERVVRVFKKMKWDRNGEGFYDGGFFTTREEDSYAKLCAQTITGASSAGTRSSYLSLVNSYLEPYFSNQTSSTCNEHTLDVLSFGKKSQVLYVVFDFTSEIQRTLVNNTIVSMIDILLEKTHTDGKPLSIPVVCLLDEFPTLGFSQEYLNIVSLGRGSNIYEILLCQSLAQLKSVYKEKAEIFLDNADIKYFLGSNDIDTAKRFSGELGVHKVIDESALLQGTVVFEQAPLVSPHTLLQDVKEGECYATLFRHQPLHGGFEMYYKTEEYYVPFFELSNIKYKEQYFKNCVEEIRQRTEEEKIKIKKKIEDIERRKEEILRLIKEKIEATANNSENGDKFYGTEIDCFAANNNKDSAEKRKQEILKRLRCQLEYSNKNDDIDGNDEKQKKIGVSNRSKKAKKN